MVDKLTKIKKPLTTHDLVILKPNQGVSVTQVMECMEKEGLRGLTIEELLSLKEVRSTWIEPKETDIIIEPETDK